GGGAGAGRGGSPGADRRLRVAAARTAARPERGPGMHGCARLLCHIDRPGDECGTRACTVIRVGGTFGWAGHAGAVVAGPSSTRYGAQASRVTCVSFVTGVTRGRRTDLGPRGRPLR